MFPPGETIFLDGGLATELEARGHVLDGALWSAALLATAPDTITSVHAAYVAAGADVVIGASYQATHAGFAAAGLGDGDALLRRSVELARRARPRYVAASVGPYGAALADGSEFRGDYGLDEAALRDWHAERWRVLSDARPDVLACETLPSFAEARALASLLDGVPAWFSFQCRDGAHLADGTPLEECARFLAAFPQVVAVGVNCTAPRYVTPLIEAVRRGAPEKRVVVYPNSGETWDARARAWTGPPDDRKFAEQARGWHAAGATLIGGCCRTSPATTHLTVRSIGGRKSLG